MIMLSLDECPSLEDLYSASQGEKVKVEDRVYEVLDSARRIYEEEAGKRRVYGYCTGLGDMYGHSGSCGPHWEETVLREHAVGVGPVAPERLSRAFLYARLAQLSRGRAPVRGITARRIEEALNNGIIPRIPLYGSVGASGDLAPSAHAFLCIYRGVGEAWYKGGVAPCRRALEREGLEPIDLEPGEALALINNTAWSTALVGLGVLLGERLLKESLLVASKTLRVTGCNSEHFSVEVLQAKKSCSKVGVPGAGCDGRRIQDPYSIRCIPQVYGSVANALRHAREVVEAELCSSTENPLVAGGHVFHSCNFHSLPVGLVGDYASISLASISNMIERRISQLMRSKITGRPEYLASGDSSVGAMIIQYTAASLAASIRRLSVPSTVHSIPTSGLQEDLVPMSPDSGLKLLEALDMLAWLIAAEDLVADIALGVEDLRDPSAGLAERYRRITGSIGGVIPLHTYTGYN